VKPREGMGYLHKGSISCPYSEYNHTAPSDAAILVPGTKSLPSHLMYQNQSLYTDVP